MKNNVEQNNVEHSSKNKCSPYGTWKCEKCNIIFETRKRMYEHKRDFHPIPKGTSWNKGLTKETSDIVRKRAEKLKDDYKTGKLTCHNVGKPLTEEHKKKISNSMKRFYKEHKELVPYKLNHSSKESYPEKYFKELFIKEKIEFSQELYVDGYFLDFSFGNLKLDLEIDGSQHWLDKRIIEHDKVRTSHLNAIGWEVIRIRWDEWQKKSNEEKKIWVEHLKEKNQKTTRNTIALDKKKCYNNQSKRKETTMAMTAIRENKYNTHIYCNGRYVDAWCIEHDAAWGAGNTVTIDSTSTAGSITILEYDDEGRRINSYGYASR